MQNWKRLLLIGAGFGGGFALVLAALLGASKWYSTRINKAPDWNTSAIRASYNTIGFSTASPNPYITFEYSLENATDQDYALPERLNTEVMAVAPDHKGYQPDSNITLPDSLFIPAKQKVIIQITKKVQYTDAYPEWDRTNMTKLASFMDRRLKEIDGFVIFDRTHRYKIELPNGWKGTVTKP